MSGVALATTDGWDMLDEPSHQRVGREPFGFGVKV